MKDPVYIRDIQTNKKQHKHTHAKNKNFSICSIITIVVMTFLTLIK